MEKHINYFGNFSFTAGEHRRGGAFRESFSVRSYLQRKKTLNDAKIDFKPVSRLIERLQQTGKLEQAELVGWAAPIEHRVRTS